MSKKVSYEKINHELADGGYARLTQILENM